MAGLVREGHILLLRAKPLGLINIETAVDLFSQNAFADRMIIRLSLKLYDEWCGFFFLSSLSVRRLES